MLADDIKALNSLDERGTRDYLYRYFNEVYGGADEKIVCVVSPGRINIIGEHIDYNGGLVFPAAINRYLYILIRKRSDSSIFYDDVRFPGRLQFTIHDTFVYNEQNSYANYLNGMISILSKKGLELKTGFEVLIFSKLPAGGGISSSSALSIGFGYALTQLFDFKISGVDLAKVGQRSEHEFMGVNCGIMDQFVIAMGKYEKAILLNTATLEYEYVPLELGAYKIVIMNSNKQRKLSDSKYNERKAECEKALGILQKEIPIQNLCQLNSQEFEKYEHLLTDSVLKKRVRHCVFENARVYKASEVLKNGDIPYLGRLLNQSHRSLKEDYEVSCFELDVLQEIAVSQDGCLGARMIGAGFGGCAIALVHESLLDSFIHTVEEQYAKKTSYNVELYVCIAGEGVSLC